MKKTFTLYPEILDIPNTVPSPESFYCENTQSYLTGNQVGPSRSALRNILNYAMASDILKTKKVGTVHLIYN